MLIMIVDDNGEKASKVEELLRLECPAGHDVQFVRSESLSAAVQSLVEVKYDLIVLDLMIPFVTGGRAEIGAGLDLLKFVRKSGGKNSETHVVGLSAFPEQVDAAYAQFQKNGVVIADYSAGDEWSEPITRIFQSALSQYKAATKLDFVIVVALEEERAGFSYAEIELGTVTVVDGLNVQFATIAYGDDFASGAIVRCRQMGLAAAIVDTTRAIYTFRPNIVCMSGICAGYSGQSKLGQLVLASPAWEYQAGKWVDDGFEIAPHQIQLRAATRARTEQIIASEAFMATIESDLPFDFRRPSERVKPMLAPAATGSAVIADSSRLNHIIVQHRKLAAIDMETYGVYYACHEATWNVEHFFSVKTVVDLADKEKGDSLHKYGSAVSARAVVEVIRSLLVS